MSTTWWAVLAWAVLGLRLLGALAVGTRQVPAWSGPLVEVLLWIGGPAILDPAALGNGEFWIGLVALLLLWAPVVALATRTSIQAPGRAAPRRRSEVVVLAACAVFAVAVQAAATHMLLAGTVDEVTAGRVCLIPRKTTELSGEDLFPAPPGPTLTVCVQGRPGGGYIGD